MGKVMLAVLCFIPLVLCVGAPSPPVTSTPGSPTDYIGMIDDLENVLVQMVNSWKLEIAFKTTSWTQALNTSESKLLISLYNRFVKSIERVMGFLREIVLQDSVSPSREGNVRYDVKSPVEKLSAASSILSDKGKPRENLNPRRTGLIHDIPGFPFPGYTDIPDTSFDCSSQAYIPGIYADTETGCQVFHVCWPHKKESFLCPIGTIFNQAILACDFWYSSDCALASSYYGANVPTEWFELSKLRSVGDLLGKENSESVVETEVIPKLRDWVLTYTSKLIPVKAKVIVFRKPRYSDFNTVETSIDGEKKAQDDVHVTEEFTEIPELKNTELSLNLQPREPRDESDCDEFEERTELPLLVVPKRPCTKSEGVEIGTSKLPPTFHSREPRAEGDDLRVCVLTRSLNLQSSKPPANVDFRDSTELPGLVAPRKMCTESCGVEFGKLKKLPQTLSREPQAECDGEELEGPIELPVSTVVRKSGAHQDASSTLDVICDVLSLVENILKDEELFGSKR